MSSFVKDTKLNEGVESDGHLLDFYKAIDR